MLHFLFVIIIIGVASLFISLAQYILDLDFDAGPFILIFISCAVIAIAIFFYMIAALIANLGGTL